MYNAQYFEQVLSALAVVVVLAMFLERALSLPFEWGSLKDFLERKKLRAPLAFLLAWVICWQMKFDLLQVMSPLSKSDGNLSRGRRGPDRRGDRRRQQGRHPAVPGHPRLRQGSGGRQRCPEDHVHDPAAAVGRRSRRPRGASTTPTATAAGSSPLPAPPPALGMAQPSPSP